MNFSAIKKILAPLLLTTLLFVGLFGLFHITVSMNNPGQGMGCLYMDIASLCTMNPFQHIAVWQNVFTASFPKEIFSLIAFILLIILFAFTSWSFWRNSKIALFVARVWQFISQIFIVRNPLQEAFSNGILHPKIF